jgi:hypothetical protein
MQAKVPSASLTSLASRHGARFDLWEGEKAQRARGFIARAGELFPLTVRGVGVLASMGFALWFYGFRALDGVWFVAGIGLLALCGVTLASVALAALRMHLWGLPAVPAEIIRTETQRLTATAFSVPRLRWWLFVDVRLEWIRPRGVDVYEVAEGPRLVEEVRLFDHGELRRVVRRIVVRDVFGLSSIALRRTAEVELDVLPHTGALRSLPLLRSLSGGDDVPHPMGIAQGDRLELRRYAPGDPARFIHWKAYARTQKLVVRMPERALSQAHRVAAFLVAADGDGPSAGAARVALEEGAFGSDFRFGADGTSTPVSTLAAGLVCIVRSSAARAEPAGSLRAFVDAVEREGPASLVLFVPPQLGAIVDRVQDVVRQRARPVRVVIGIDGIHPSGPRSGWRRFAFEREVEARVAMPALREVIAAYRRFGCDVVVLDRDSGRVLGEAHLTRAEQPKGAAA